jgi:hypothetical protein
MELVTPGGLADVIAVAGSGKTRRLQLLLRWAS